MAVRAHRRWQTHAEQPPHPSERRLSARQDLRIRLRRRRSGRRRRRLRRRFATSPPTRSTIPTPITPAARVYGEGISQNGRFLRDFLYQGFNADEEGRIALDGVLAHVAGAGRGSFNYRFAQPSRDAQPTSSVFFPTDIFPFTDLPEKDPVTGDTGGLLDRATAEKVVPKIFFSNTSYEYWGRACALIHVSADGKQTRRSPTTSASITSPGCSTFPVRSRRQKGKGDLLGQQPQSPLPIRYFWRAMIANMDAWVRSNTLPPASSYPKIADGTLVPLSDYALPAIPGVNRPHEANAAYRLDFGPQLARRNSQHSAAESRPAFPGARAAGRCRRQRARRRAPAAKSPFRSATYASWNLRDPSIGAPDQRVSFEASYIPFPKTAAERQKTGDPRKSIAERYSDRNDYMTKYTSAVDELIKQRWILPEDRSAFLQRGEQEWQEATQ